MSVSEKIGFTCLLDHVTNNLKPCSTENASLLVVTCGSLRLYASMNKFIASRLNLQNNLSVFKVTEIQRKSLQLGVQTRRKFKLALTCILV
jgi:hypothetical protein